MFAKDSLISPPRKKVRTFTSIQSTGLGTFNLQLPTLIQRLRTFAPQLPKSACALSRAAKN